jgi:hypothetical protein
MATAQRLGIFSPTRCQCVEGMMLYQRAKDDGDRGLHVVGFSLRCLWFQGARGCASVGDRRRIFLGGACAFAVAPPHSHVVVDGAALIINLSTS